MFSNTFCQVIAIYAAHCIWLTIMLKILQLVESQRIGSLIPVEEQPLVEQVIPMTGIKCSPYSITELGFRSWSWFLAVSQQVTWVINPAVGCHYFPPGLQLPSQPLRGLLPILLLGEQRHDGCEQFAYDCYPTASRLLFAPGPSAPESSMLTTWLPSLTYCKIAGVMTGIRRHIWPQRNFHHSLPTTTVVNQLTFWGSHVPVPLSLCIINYNHRCMLWLFSVQTGHWFLIKPPILCVSILILPGLSWVQWNICCSVAWFLTYCKVSIVGAVDDCQSCDVSVHSCLNCHVHQWLRVGHFVSVYTYLTRITYHFVLVLENVRHFTCVILS